MIDPDTKETVLARLRRIEGQVKGVHRMVAEDEYCVDILLQIAAIQGALTQVQKVLLGRHIESCVRDAFRSGRQRERNRKIRELLDVVTRFNGERR